MGLFDKLPFGKKKDDFLDNPPDFSQPPGQHDPLQGDALYGKDPLQNPDPFAAQNDPFASSPSPAQGAPGMPGGSDAFSHEVFGTGGNADAARQYAQGLGGGNQGPHPGAAQQPAQGFAGALTGHEAELILERLDTIKAEIDAVKQRMMRIERFMEQAEQKAGTRRYF